MIRTTGFKRFLPMPIGRRPRTAWVAGVYMGRYLFPYALSGWGYTRQSNADFRMGQYLFRNRLYLK